MTDLKQRLQACSPLNVELAHEALDYISKLERALEVYDRERARFRHAHPEMTGAYFLTGGHGKCDNNLLPEYVTICPTYGAGWEHVYKKTDRTVSYEGS